MTPAINSLKKAKIPHQIHSYDHDPAFRAFGQEAAEKLNISYDRLFKTLIALVDEQQFVTALVPVSKQLDLKELVRALGSKKARMAEIKDVERMTGYIPGGVSPIGQKKKLTTVMDASARNFATIFVSAGKRGLQIEIAPKDLVFLTHAAYFQIAR